MAYPNLNNSFFANIGWSTARIMFNSAGHPETLLIQCPSMADETYYTPPKDVWINGTDQIRALRDFLNEHVKG